MVNSQKTRSKDTKRSMHSRRRGSNGQVSLRGAVAPHSSAKACLANEAHGIVLCAA